MRRGRGVALAPRAAPDRAANEQAALEGQGPWQHAGCILRAYHVALIEGGGVSVAVVTRGGWDRGAIRGGAGAGAKARVGCQPRAAAGDRLHAAGSGARRRPVVPARLQAVTGVLAARRDLWADA